MADTDLLTRVMQACARNAPAPLFPAEYAATAGLPRADIDAAIDKLRLNGYLQIVDWVQGKGQGYTVTAAGIAALEKPTELRRPAAAPEPEQPTFDDRIWQRGEAIRAALLEPRRPTVTMVLLFANLAMFAVGMVVGLTRGITADDYLFSTRSVAYNELLDSIGALANLRVIGEQQWWRLVSYQFLHIGLAHLAMNMISLYSLGALLEGMWGSRRLLILYLVSGIVGGVAVIMVGRAAAGASGAISGLLTSVGVWLWLNRDCLPEQFTSHMTTQLGISLLMLVVISTFPNVSWEGHLGGAVGGALVSVPLHYERFGRLWQRVVSWIAIVMIPLAGIAAAYFVQRPKRDAFVHYQMLQQFDARLRITETAVFEGHNRFLVPLLHTVPAPWYTNPQFMPACQQACDEAIAKIRPLLEELAALQPINERHAQEIDNVHRYFQAWSELYESLKRQLNESNRWKADERRALDERLTALRDLRKPLEENIIMPRCRPLVPADEPPPAAPPPNTA